MNIRHAAVPALILVGGALLAGCGDTTSGDGSTPGTTMESTMAPTMDSTMESDS
ncbi:hypothetical protein [Demequina oxidasica]|uniref:hypothetical protein n=1 Tax=Demequina oxidasica TaxID=676199 RepID=UPI000ABC6547|nr:hypothetical protein [Demequina oxidasica]